jgi:hypothetical protein
MSMDTFEGSYGLDLYEVPNPGVGDMAVIRSIAASRSTLVIEIDDALATVHSIAADVPSQWSGSAAEMNVNATLALVPDLTTLRASYETHASALETYAAEVDRIRIAAESQIATYHEAGADIGSATAARDRIAGLGGGATPSSYKPIHGAPAGTYEEEDWQQAVALDQQMDESREVMAAARAALDVLVADRAAADRACADALGGDAAVGPFASATVDYQSTQDDLLALLATMSPTEAALFLERHKFAVDLLAEGNPDNAGEVAALWLSFGAGGTELARTYPRVVGNLEGASSWDRGVANKIVLDQEIAAAQDGLDNGGDRGAGYYEKRLDTLKAIRVALADGLDATPPRTIHSLDTGDMVLASVVLGDLDNAEYASYNVPGMNTTADDMEGWTNQSMTFYKEQVALLAEGGVDEKEAGRQVAVVSWIGYDTPDVRTVVSPREAEAGAIKLDASIVGTQAVRDLHNPDGRLGVIAHSYGSTTAMAALSRDRGVDTLVTYGSAGKLFSSNPILTDGWYETQAWTDGWARIGQVTGLRPTPDFDPESQPLESEGGYWVNPDTGEGKTLVDAYGHSGYLVKDTGSLHNMAAVTIDRPDLVYVREPKPELRPAPTPPE